MVVLLTILLIYLSYHFVFSKSINKAKLEKESLEFAQNYRKTPFSISKIVMYSSGYGKNKNTKFGQNSWILDILQYTDIAIYIYNGEDELSYDNSVKKLWIDEVTLSSPKVGKSNLYYLDSLNFGTANVNEDFKIEDSLEFSVLNDANKENEIQSNTPVFFADCSNPITLKYVNNPIKENYSISTSDPIFFDGKLLKIAGISLDSLQANIHLKINIENNDDGHYSYNLSMPIPLEDAKNSIFDGSILVENEYENLKFLKE